MTNLSKRAKLQLKRKESLGKGDWDKALTTVKKLKKSAEHGNTDATVVMGKNMVVIRTNRRPLRETSVFSSLSKNNPDDVYKEKVAAFNQQLKQLRENSAVDREHFVRTVNESPSAEAMDFYRTVAPW